jgi:hypothetical protein
MTKFLQARAATIIQSEEAARHLRIEISKKQHPALSRCRTRQFLQPAWQAHRQQPVIANSTRCAASFVAEAIDPAYGKARVKDVERLQTDAIFVSAPEGRRLPLRRTW